MEHCSFILFLIDEIFHLFYLILFRFFFKYYKLFSFFGNPLISLWEIYLLIIFYLISLLKFSNEFCNFLIYFLWITLIVLCIIDFFFLGISVNDSLLLWKVELTKIILWISLKYEISMFSGWIYSNNFFVLIYCHQFHFC